MEHFRNIVVQSLEAKLRQMPIKLLHHKSWHVYSKDNIERVRKDEAEERAKSEAEDQRLRQESSQARLDVLRGIAPKEVLKEPDVNAELARASRRRREEDAKPQRKRKRDEETRVLDRQLSSATSRESRPVATEDSQMRSEFVVEEQRQTGRRDDNTFGTMDKASWYSTADEDRAATTAKQRRRIESTKSALDPLHDMKAFLARKKAFKAEQRSRETTDSARVEDYEPDRYHKVTKAEQIRSDSVARSRRRAA